VDGHHTIMKLIIEIKEVDSGLLVHCAREGDGTEREHLVRNYLEDKTCHATELALSALEIMDRRTAEPGPTEPKAMRRGKKHA